MAATNFTFMARQRFINGLVNKRNRQITHLLQMNKYGEKWMQDTALECLGRTIKELVDASMEQGATTEYATAFAAHSDHWVPAHNGKEEPYRTRHGRRVLYVYNHARQEHGYLDLGTDIVERELREGEE